MKDGRSPDAASGRGLCTCMNGAAGFSSCPTHKPPEVERWELHVRERDFLTSQPTTNTEAVDADA